LGVNILFEIAAARFVKKAGTWRALRAHQKFDKLILKKHQRIKKLKKLKKLKNYSNN
jgi:hypothetical protein